MKSASEFLQNAIFTHDTTLKKHGQYGIDHRCNHKAFNSNYSEDGKYSNIPLILDNKALEFFRCTQEGKFECNKTILDAAEAKQCDKL